MKFGGEVRTIRMYRDRKGGITYSFSNLNNFLNNVAANIRFVGDLTDPSLINGGVTGERKGEQEYYIGYAQDEWKLAFKVTLNYGMRYEYYTPMREAENRAVLFNINTGKLDNPNNAFYQSVKTNFGPRVGLSFSPNARTAFRVGFGIYYRVRI